MRPLVSNSQKHFLYTDPSVGSAVLIIVIMQFTVLSVFVVILVTNSENMFKLCAANKANEFY